MRLAITKISNEEKIRENAGERMYYKITYRLPNGKLHSMYASKEAQIEHIMDSIGNTMVDLSMKISAKSIDREEFLEEI